MGLRELLEPLFEKRDQEKAAARSTTKEDTPALDNGFYQSTQTLISLEPTFKSEQQNINERPNKAPELSTNPARTNLSESAKASDSRIPTITKASENSSSSTLRTGLSKTVRTSDSPLPTNTRFLETSSSSTSRTGLSEVVRTPDPSSPNNTRFLETSSSSTSGTALSETVKISDLRLPLDTSFQEIPSSSTAITELSETLRTSESPLPTSTRVLDTSNSSTENLSLPGTMESSGNGLPKNIYASLTGRKRKKPGDSSNDLEKNSTTPKRSKDDPGQLPTPVITQNTNSVSLSGPVRTPRSKSKAAVVSEQIVDTSMMSEWYRNINMKEKYKRSDEVTVSYIKEVIDKCVETCRQGKTADFSELRTQIHNMELWTPNWIKGVLLKKTGILEEKGLGRLIEGPDSEIFPWDIRDDAKALWLRWVVGDTDGSLLRGIIQVKKTFENNTPGTSRTIDHRYIWKRSWEVVGHNGLINGQWWPLRICCVRDGAHGELEAGISGRLGENVIEGAYSVVLADGGYQDQDSLNTIQYCSTESKTSNPTRGTQMLTKSWHSGRPIRVLRAAPKTAAKKKQNKYLPKRGIRYDGLYQIKDMEILNAETAYMRFSLRRIAGQDPVRWTGELARPTSQQLRELMLLQLFA